MSKLEPSKLMGESASMRITRNALFLTIGVITVVVAAFAYAGAESDQPMKDSTTQFFASIAIIIGALAIALGGAGFYYKWSTLGNVAVISVGTVMVALGGLALHQSMATTGKEYKKATRGFALFSIALTTFITGGVIGAIYGAKAVKEGAGAKAFGFIPVGHV